jgi:diaminopimelate epimerase
MKKIPFLKMSGGGNDFILVDNREGILSGLNLGKFSVEICQRRFSVGADGLILIEGSEVANFKWQFFNADGSMAEMCGNGGRCAARFAHFIGIGGKRLSFETKVGIIKAEITGDIVKLAMTEPSHIVLDVKLFFGKDEHTLHLINAGVPHAVEFVENLENVDVIKIGRLIRNHERFRPAGTNVNFITVLDRSNIRIRTYERGVEDETLACGTGSIASALIASQKRLVVSPLSIHTKGGEILRVYFRKYEDNFKEIYLEGEAHIVYEGEFWEKNF